MSIKSILLVIGCLCFSLSLSAQINLTLLPVDSTFQGLPAEINFKKSHLDSLSAIQELRKVIYNLQGDGFLEASVDSFQQSDSIFTAFLHVGQQYEWAALDNGNVPPVLLSAAGFRPSNFKNRQLNSLAISRLQDRVLQKLENNGYPFARVWLDSMTWSGSRLAVKIFSETRHQVFFEKLTVEGDAKVSNRFLQQYLGIKTGEPFDRSKILNLPRRLRELPFLTQTQPASLIFRGDRAEIVLFLDRKKSSRFDFIIGVLPNNAETGKLLLTGSFTGEIQNQFGRGERIFLEFERLRPETQKLNFALRYPYLLGLPFSFDGKFNLYKRDTTYLDVIWGLSLQNQLREGEFWGVFWKQSNSNLLTFNRLEVLQRRRLPNALDLRRAEFGLEYFVNRLDYRFNPRKGWTAGARAGAGIKTIEKNSAILDLKDENDPDFDFGTLYDQLDLRNFQYRFEANAAIFLPLFQSQTVKLGGQGAYVLSQTPVFQNEQYRIGGNRLLRGFDEESVFTTNYAVSTLEYRFLTGQNSYLFAFGDLGWINNKTDRNNSKSTLYGFGAGLTFESRIGVFGVSYAFGTQVGSPLNLRSGKIHFGYVSLF